MPGRLLTFADIRPGDRCAMAEALKRASHVLHLYRSAEQGRNTGSAAQPRGVTR